MNQSLLYPSTGRQGLHEELCGRVYLVTRSRICTLAFYQQDAIAGGVGGENSAPSCGIDGAFESG